MLVVSFISLGFRTGIIVALSVPLVLAITFVGMMLLGIDFQRISLGALIIALGLLVDDAIIAVEMMMVKLEQGFSRMEAATYAYTSTAFPMLTGTLITAAGFVPVGFAKSSAGEYTNSIFWVVGLSLVISWFVAVLFTPWIGYRLLPTPKAGAHHDPYGGRLYTAVPQAGDLVHHLAQDHDRRHRRSPSSAAMASFQLVQKQFFPTANRPELIVDLRLAQGASYRRDRRRGEEARAVAGQERRCRLLHLVYRRGLAALLPADGARAHQLELRPGHRHDQGPRRRASGSWPRSTRCSRRTSRRCAAACSGCRTARRSPIR